MPTSIIAQSRLLWLFGGQLRCTFVHCAGNDQRSDSAERGLASWVALSRWREVPRDGVEGPPYRLVTEQAARPGYSAITLFPSPLWRQV